jgi:O-antigen/teichoic acid export membrane protein
LGKSLKSKTVKGVFWSAIDRFSALGIQMICTLIIARILTPADFGILGMITVFTAVGLTIIDGGFASAIIRRKDVTPLDYTSVFYFNIFISILLYAIFFIVSPYISKFYDESGLTSICRITFLILPINALGLIQNTILVKRIDFRSLAIISFLSALISGLIGIFLAYYLKSVWALVWQNFLMYFLRTIILWIVGGWYPMLRFSIQPIKQMWNYSINLLAFGLISNITQNLYPLIIGKIYSATQLGLYSQADRLQKLPSTSITDVIQRVCFPVLSEVNDNNERLRDAYRKIIMVAFFIVFPLMMLLIGTADQLIPLLLGNNWMGAIVFFKILCIAGSLYPLHSINLNILNVVGKSKISLYLEITRKSLLAILIFIFMNQGIITFVWMQVVYGVIVLILNVYFCGKEIRYSVFSQLKDLFPTVAISFLALLGCSIVSFHEIIDNRLLTVIIKSLIFITIYWCTNVLFSSQAYMYMKPIFYDLKNKMVHHAN